MTTPKQLTPDEEAREKIAQTPNADLRRAAIPWVFLDDGTAVRVCPECGAEPLWDGPSPCRDCRAGIAWEDLCPPRYRRHATIEQLATGPNPWQPDELAELQKFFGEESDARNLGLISGPGRYKTTAVFAVCRRLIVESQASVVYATATEMLLDLQARQFEAGAHHRYTKPDVLFLDELGDRDTGLTEFQRQQLHLVLEKRYREEKTLLWTSNLTLTQLRQWCHDRTWERLWDETLVLQIGGKTARRLAAA